MESPACAAKIAIVSFPWASRAPYKFLSDVLKIIDPLAISIYLIGGNTQRIATSSPRVTFIDINVRMHYVNSIRPRFYSVLLWAAKCLLAQLKTSIEILRLRKNVDLILFYMAYPYHLLPLCVSKLLRKKSIEVLTRSKPIKRSWTAKTATLLDAVVYGLLDGISPESDSLVSNLGLHKFRDKLLVCGARFVDTEFYSPQKQVEERDAVVGYIGRLHSVKGVKDFVEAIPMIHKERPDTTFLIGGDGDLADWLEKKIERMTSQNAVKITMERWIPEEVFPQYLNTLKLLVLPTQHNEGLPTIILEAMACGTPVLAPEVGGIPDVLIDGETGFTLETTSPESIAENVLRVLRDENLDYVSRNARQTIESLYTYDAAVERYKKMIEKVCYPSGSS